jgi:hypothetical protein
VLLKTTVPWAKAPTLKAKQAMPANILFMLLVFLWLFIPDLQI